jgi:hypothetical protein
VLVAAVWAKQYRVCVREVRQGSIFVGKNAAREHELVRLFADTYGRPALHLDEANIASFSSRGRARLAGLVREWFAVWKEIWAALGARSKTDGLPTRYCLTYAITGGYRYIYVRSWFRSHLGAAGREGLVGVTTAGFVPYAAAAASAKLVFMAHGLLRRSLIFPTVAQVHCLTGVEAKYLRHALPCVPVSVETGALRALTTRRRVVIASDYWAEQDFELCASFIAWAQAMHVPVIVRQHPDAPASYWEKWRGAAGVEISRDRRDFGSFLDAVRPRLLATWFSTTLLDALSRGVLPVTLAQDPFELSDIIFPVRDIAACWPEDRELLDALIDDPERCAVMSAAKYATVMDPGPAQRADRAAPPVH